MIVSILSLLLLASFLWVIWVKPNPVDMAQFAPANSMIYLEVNQPAEVLWAIGRTDVWKLLGSIDIASPVPTKSGMWQKLVRVTGLGPIDSVIMARSQVAVVVTNLGTSESGDTLSVKPEAAMIVETHTSEGRIRAPIERRLETLVRATYLNPQVEHSVVDGVELVEWGEPEGRKLIAAFDGSVVIIGNSRQVVDACLAVAHQGAPSLQRSPELHSARMSGDAHNALVFGYVPAVESPKLMSLGIPILSGQKLIDPQFQRLAENTASKLIGTLAWTSRPFRGGIEDRYYIGLHRAVVEELRPGFGSPQRASLSVLSTDFYSNSEYRLEDPLRAWQTLRTSISRRADPVTAVVFNTTLRTSLTTYGIEAPEVFLSAVKSPLNTVKFDQDGERQLLVARVSDRASLAKLFSTTMQKKGNSSEAPVTILENTDGTLGATLDDSLIVLGHPTDVQQYYRIVRMSTVTGNKQSSQVIHFAESDDAHVVTYTNDVARIRGCMAAIVKTYRREFPVDWEARLAASPYATTQTTLTAVGLTRITRSPLGQFSSIIPLLLPDRIKPASHD
jgi:hypothetical protein